MLHLNHLYQKINNTFIENAEDFNIIMPVHNLLEYNDNYSMTSGSWWNYYRDEVNDAANENNDGGNCKINKNKAPTSRLFQYKTIIIGSTLADNNT